MTKLHYQGTCGVCYYRTRRYSDLANAKKAMARHEHKNKRECRVTMWTPLGQGWFKGKRVA